MKTLWQDEQGNKSVTAPLSLIISAFAPVHDVRQTLTPVATADQCLLLLDLGAPYDRPATSMAPFPLCVPCETEYRNPADRRFHAQPVACPIADRSWSGEPGEAAATRESALSAAVAMLEGGGIVAVKGLGGFRTVCDALNPQAVRKLRARKQRPTRPLAVG